MFGVRGPDQSEIRLVGDGEDDPPVFALKEIAFAVIIQLWHHDMAAPHQTHAFGGIDAHGVADDVFDPRAACIHQHPRPHDTLRAAVLGLKRDVPDTVLLLGRYDFGADIDLGAARLGVAGVQDNQTAVFNPAIGIFIRLFKAVLQRGPFGGAMQI